MLKFLYDGNKADDKTAEQYFPGIQQSQNLNI